MTCGELGFVIVDNGVRPDELAVGVHFCDEFVGANRAFVGLEEDLSAYVVDIALHKLLVTRMSFGNDREERDVGRDLFKNVQNVVLQRGLDQTLIDHTLFLDLIIDLLGIVPEFVDVQIASAVIGIKKLIDDS